MKTLMIILLLVLLPGAGSFIYFGYRALEDEPLVVTSAAANSDNAQRVKLLIGRYQDGVEEGKQPAELSISEQDLESLLAFATRGIPRSRASANITSQGMSASMTIQLPENPVGRFLNISFGLLPSEKGLLLSHVTIGKVNLPPDTLLPIIRRGLDTTLGKGSGETILSTVSSVKFSGDEMSITYSPDEERSKEVISKITQSDQLRIADPERVQIYFIQLQKIAAEVRGGYLPLTRYIAPTFELAARRSKAPDTNAVNENKSAIMALSLYFGDSHMMGLFGETAKKYFSGPRYGAHNVSLYRRHDLVQHYLTSAGLQIAAGVDVANAIGEFKEIADTLRGGSGFSFSDIAADRAGVTLAEHAVDKNKAERLQAIMAGAASEDVYFPDITGLPDNMTQSEFESRYGNVESPKYLELMAEIERRIARAPAYGGG